MTRGELGGPDDAASGCSGIGRPWPADRPFGHRRWPRRGLPAGASGSFAASEARLRHDRRGERSDPNGLAWFNAIKLGLAEEGWLDGVQIRIEARYTAGQPELSDTYSNELAALGPDVRVCGTNSNALNAQRLLPDVTLVFVAVPDPIGIGLVRSFNQPGGNATGVAHFEASIGGKQLLLLLDIAPLVRRVGYIYNPDVGSSSWQLILPYVQEAAAQAGVELIEVPVRSLEEVDPAIASVAVLPDAGLLFPTNNWVSSNRFVFINAVNRHHIPALWAHTGIETGPISYHVDTTEAFHQAGRLAGRILDGMHPSTLPVLGAPRYVMTANLRTAASLGLSVPHSILVAADRIIE